MDLKKLTATQRKHYHYMADAMRRLEWDLHHHIEATSRVPEEWHEIARRVEDQPTERVTIRLDRDVLRFFRSMGAGYGPRINEVLRSYMHARLAGVIRGAETVNHYARAQDYHDCERPMWGEAARMAGLMDGPTEAERRAEQIALMQGEMRRRGLE